MTTAEWAARLDGREYGAELMRAEAAQAKQDGVVILFGASDDLVEVAGAFADELSAHDGTTVLLTRDGVAAPVDREDQDVLHKYRLLASANDRAQRAAKVRAVWAPENSPLSWRFETEVPHARFTICEDGEPYCEGVVIAVADLPEG